MVKESEVEAEEVLVAEVEFESAAATAPTRKAAAMKRTVDQRERAAVCMSAMAGEGKGEGTKDSDEGVVGRTSHVLALRRAFTAAREREAGMELKALARRFHVVLQSQRVTLATLIIIPSSIYLASRFIRKICPSCYGGILEMILEPQAEPCRHVQGIPQKTTQQAYQS